MLRALMVKPLKSLREMLMRTRGFVLVRVYMDSQSAFHSIATQFENVAIHTGGAGDYVTEADAKIRRIKEMYQCIKASLHCWS
jgi:hypothetical protein